MRPLERWKRQHTGGELAGTGNTKVFSGGGQTVEEHYANQKAYKNEWKVAYVLDDSDPDNEASVKHYTHGGVKSRDILDENEPAFIPLSEEGLPPGNSSKRRKHVTWDGAADIARRPLEEKMFACEACHETFERSSFLAFVNARGGFCTRADPFLTRVLIDNGMNTFANQFEVTKLVCVKCFQKIHAPEKDANGVP